MSVLAFLAAVIIFVVVALGGTINLAWGFAALAAGHLLPGDFNLRR